jgi:hypothetical protein
MNKLITLNISRVHHTEFGQFIVRFFKDFGNSTLDIHTDPDLKRIFDAIQAQIPAFLTKKKPTS